MSSRVGVSPAEVAWPVRTERLELRPARLEDADAMHAYWRLPEVGRWLGIGPLDRDAFAERLVGRLDDTVAVEFGGILVGDLMIKVGDGWAQADVADRARGVQAELGWVFDPAYGGRGLATEAVRAAIGICFDGLGLRRVIGSCFAANLASSRLMERIGMRLESSTTADSLHRSGEWLDGRTYALLSSEWPTT